MCATCGCSDDAQPTVTDLQTGETTALAAHDASHQNHHHHHSHEHHGDGHHHHHDHDHDHAHDHGHTHSHHHGDGPTQVDSASGLGTNHSHPGGTIMRLERAVLEKNNRLAERNRGWFTGRNVLALNLVSSPGAGKTTLLERTIRDLGDELEFQVVEGDQATLQDSRRIQATGCRVVQINTGTGCHLEADMLARGLQQLSPPADSVLMIENVGNLVCPALFDLGERAKVVIVSVTEGEDKPIKYPHMFRAGQVMILNKLDLLPYVDFDVERFLDYARQVNPRLQTIRLSAKTGDGLGEWYDWIRRQRHQAQQLAEPAFAQT